MEELAQPSTMDTTSPAQPVTTDREEALSVVAVHPSVGGTPESFERLTPEPSKRLATPQRTLFITEDNNEAVQAAKKTIEQVDG